MKISDIPLKCELRGTSPKKSESFPFDEAFFHAWWVARVEVCVLKCFCWFVMRLHI